MANGCSPAARTRRVRLWNLQGYQEVRVLHATVFAGHEDAVLSARFSRDGKQIVTASRDRTASLWDAANGKPLTRFQEGHEFLVSGAVFFPDGKRLATGAGDNSVRIWDVDRRHAAGRAHAHRPHRHARRFARRQLDRDRQPRQRRQALERAHRRSRSATLERPRRRSFRARVLAQRRSAGQRRRSRPRAAVAQEASGNGADWAFERELDGHNGSITALRFTPDGQRLVTASGDHTCGQWDVATGEEQRAARAQASRMGVVARPIAPTARSRSPPATTARRGSGGWPMRRSSRP